MINYQPVKYLSICNSFLILELRFCITNAQSQSNNFDHDNNVSNFLGLRPQQPSQKLCPYTMRVTKCKHGEKIRNEREIAPNFWASVMNTSNVNSKINVVRSRSVGLIPNFGLEQTPTKLHPSPNKFSD